MSAKFMKAFRSHIILAAVLAFILVAFPISASTRTVLLVGDLSPTGVSPQDAAVISDLLRGELTRSGKFVVVERTEMETIVQELRFQMASCSDDSCAVQLGMALSAEKVVVGRVAKIMGTTKLVGH